MYAKKFTCPSPKNLVLPECKPPPTPPHQNTHEVNGNLWKGFDLGILMK